MEMVPVYNHFSWVVLETDLPNVQCKSSCKILNRIHIFFLFIDTPFTVTELTQLKYVYATLLAMQI